MSSEWFSPADVPGIAIPFYLAHPRLMKLEKKMMLEVEGAPGPSAWPFFVTRQAMPCSTPTSCNAAGAGNSCSAHLRNTTRSMTGPIRPAGVMSSIFDAGTRRAIRTRISRKLLRCGLRPRSNWRTRYAGWPALKKLEYVDDLMGEIAGERPPVTTRERVDPLPKLSQTLGEHYQKKQAFYAFKPPKTYDRDRGRVPLLYVCDCR